MAKTLTLPNAERLILEEVLSDALTLREELVQSVEAGIMSDLLLRAHDETITKARAVLNFTTTA